MSKKKISHLKQKKKIRKLFSLINFKIILEIVKLIKDILG